MPGPPSGAKRTSTTPSNVAKSAPNNAPPALPGRKDNPAPPPPPPPVPGVPAPAPGVPAPAPASQWASFSGQYFPEFGGMPQGAPPLSAFQKKLEEKPLCSIESLLDDEEILEEFRHGNALLLQRLSAYEGMRALIDQVTRGPIESDQEDSCLILRRRPWVVCELLTSGCNDGIFEAFRQPEGSDLLDLVWSFLDRDFDHATAAVLAGYFCSIVTALVSHCAVEVATHLRSRRDPAQLFDLILQRIESRSFVDLLISLLCIEVPASTPDQIVFPRARLAWRLFDHLCKQGSESSVLEHIVLVIEALIARACANTLYQSDDILKQFSETALVTALLDKATSGVSEHGCSAVSVAAATVLSIAVSHMHLLEWNPLLPVRNPDFRPTPPSPRSSSPPLPEDSPSAALAETDAETETVAPDNWSDFVLDSNGAAIADTICSSLPSLCSVLDSVGVADLATIDEQTVPENELPALRQRFQTGEVRNAVAALRANHPPRSSYASMQFISEEEDPLHCTRPNSAIILEVIGLIAHLAMTGRPEVFQAALHAAVLPRCLQVIFRFPWNSLLHNAVTSVFRVFIVQGPVAAELVTDFFSRSDLLERVVAEVQYDARVRSQCLAEGEGFKGQQSLLRQRVGYVGHLRSICQDLVALSNRCPEVEMALQGMEGWSEVVVPELEDASIVIAEPLGGVAPEESSPEGSPVRSEFDCISAVQTLMASLTDEVDLNLEDLRDLNEELETSDEMEMAIAMAAAHAKNRSRGGAACPEPPLDDDAELDDLSIS